MTDSLPALVRARRLAGQIARQEAGMAALRPSELQARLSALQAQIQPHFLFNALDALAEVAVAARNGADPAAAPEPAA